LKAVAIFVLDGVLLVFENTVESFVQVGNVVSAVEIVVDEYFPVAVELVNAAVHVVQARESERLAAPG
jgi:hypothetical protein